MPIKVLEELERIEIAIPDIERRAFMLQADAQDLRIRHDEIINSWKIRAEREGLDNLIAERQRLEMIAWHLRSAAEQGFRRGPGAVVMIAAGDLKSSLSHFTGTTRYIRDPFTGLIHTDGIEHLAERAEAQWLISDIGAVFHIHQNIRGMPFQALDPDRQRGEHGGPDLPRRLRHAGDLRAEIRVHRFSGRDLEDVSYRWCSDGSLGVPEGPHA